MPLLLVSVTILAVLYERADTDKRATFEIEMGKAMLAVITAALVGNIVLLIIKDFEERRKASINDLEEQRKASRGGIC